MNEIELKLKYFSFENGIFLEVGANDGIRQSTTYIYEKTMNWTGILIEPSDWFNDLKNNRPKSKHFNCALVSYDWNKSVIKGTFNELSSDAMNLMSQTEQSTIYKGGDKEVEARTMDDVISSTNYTNFDLISLDVEGSELSVLKGFNFNKHKTKYFLIEISDSPEHSRIHNLNDNYYNFNNILQLLSENNYSIECRLESGDWLFKNNNL
jgi:FkbM family methyltransferase